jgi:hypothetical protein
LCYFTNDLLTALALRQLTGARSKSALLRDFAGIIGV